ncbi:CubicO group peptidase, beta-lactamase class C family [Paenibacillus algorifonticola]|uniref:CubicO group peptidase, beta-lactamase class C family n=1 Tax=Paenibacillus algorifonticola TaxID=684063 RepID=A0A1I1ZS86_9BACL|nr:serine hydrolase domain-containing protein [Paenibacillus algorifonticola]SFE34569.1 CubicO group peptidase, beta-lactamase class C family [Paenibacillus algorifonticola]
MIVLQKKLLLCLSCLLMILSFFAAPVSAIEVRNKEEILKKIDDYVIKNMKVNHIKGTSVAIVNNDDVFYAQGYGAFSDGRGITGSTPFPVASLSKSFTALAVLQLVEQGLVDLDAPYASYFPDLLPEDQRIRDITVRHLLNQTSGLNDKVEPDMTRSPQYQSLKEINRSLNTVKLANDPGKAYSYHNPNYQYLALLVEKVSGQSFSAYLEKNVFEPLGMSDTFNVSNTRQIMENPAIPWGHYLLFGYPVSKAEPSWFIDGPAGIVSTAEDMAKWMLAQYDTRLLAPELMEQFHTAGQSGPYGMGWLAEEDEHGGRTISHSGIFWTYKAEETIYLDQQLGIAVMFDSGLNVFVNYSAFVDGIARIIKGEKAETSIFNDRNMETVMMLLVIGTTLWGGYAIFRIHRSKKSITAGKLIISSVGRLLPVLILLFLPPLVTFIGAGRVVPWFGLWTTMSSLIIWLAVLSLVNITNLVCRYRLYFWTMKRGQNNGVGQ